MSIVSMTPRDCQPDAQWTRTALNRRDPPIPPGLPVSYPETGSLLRHGHSTLHHWTPIECWRTPSGFRVSVEFLGSQQIVRSFGGLMEAMRPQTFLIGVAGHAGKPCSRSTTGAPGAPLRDRRH
jgi:hypothetical protein